MLLNQRLVEGGSAKPVYVTNASEFPSGGGGGVQDVNVVNSNLDIRDLDSALDSVAIGDGVDQLFINSDGSINVNGVNLGVIDTNNSTNTPLGISGVFPGSGTDTLNYSAIIVSVFADQHSATDGLQIQFSSDNVNWRTTDEYTYTNTVLKTYSIQTIDRYFRIIYTNGLVAQTEFQITVQLKKMAGIASSHRIEDTVSGQDDASLTKVIIGAKTPNGIYKNVDADSEGRLNVNVLTPTGIVPVAQLNTLRDGKILNRLIPELDEIVGTGGGVFDTNGYLMSVGVGQWKIYQSRKLLEYYSGKPQKVEFTFEHFAPETDVTKRVGYFNSGTISPYSANYDGIWLESSNGTITLKASRSGVETISADITTWTNYDELKEYQNLSIWDNFTVCEINFLWLGGAYIELRLVTSSGFTTVHQIIYAGTSPDVFIDYPNHSVRYEIRSTTGTGSFRYICNQVATSGSIDESGLAKGVSTGTSPITFSSTATTYPLIAVRKGVNFRENFVSIVNADILITTNDTLAWSLQINPALSAPLTYTPLANSAIEYASGNGTITVTGNGIVIANGYLIQRGSIDATLFQKNYLTSLSGSITGVQDEYVLCIHPISSSLSALGSINLLEG